MKKILILLITLLLFTSNVFSQQLPRIAVFVAVNENDCEEVRQTKRILGTRLVESIARSNLFTAVERSDRFFNEIMRAQAIQGGGQVRDDQIIERARISGEQYVIVADVTRFRGEDFVEARMLEVLSGNVLGIPASSGRQIRNMQDLITISDEVSNRLIEQTPQGRRAEDARRAEAEARRVAEETRLAEARRVAEEARLAEARRAEVARIAREEEQRRRQDSIARVEQQRRARSEQIRLNHGCNLDTPGWGNSLGFISFDSDRTWAIGNQIWSDAVQASNCSNKTSFSGGILGGPYNRHIHEFNADCRSNPGFPGDLFSWCAVRRFADQLCPYPWRVPTSDDFVVLYNALRRGRGTVRNRLINYWGADFGGYSDLIGTLYSQGLQGHYWSQCYYRCRNGHRWGATLFVCADGTRFLPSKDVRQNALTLRCVRYY